MNLPRALFWPLLAAITLAAAFPLAAALSSYDNYFAAWHVVLAWTAALFLFALLRHLAVRVVDWRYQRRARRAWRAMQARYFADRSSRS